MTFDCRSGNSDCCTPRTVGRGALGSATAVCPWGCSCNSNLVASAPWVRTRLNSPFNVSPGRRPHLRQRCSPSLLREPQKLHVIMAHLTAHLLQPRHRPDVLSLAFEALP